jgi:hypothetical protein
MAIISARNARRFFDEILDPLQQCVRNLYDGNRQVDALYLSAQVVMFAIRRGILRDVISFVDDRQSFTNPIQTALQVARGDASVGLVDLPAFPAATSIIGLGRYLGLKDPSYEEIHDPDQFTGFSQRILNVCQKSSSGDVPDGIVTGMLASTARLALLDDLPVVQDEMLAALDDRSRHLRTDTAGLSSHADAGYAVELGRAAKFARAMGDADAAIAFDQFAGSNKPDRYLGLIGSDPDNAYIHMYKEYSEIGQAGTAALLFDAAVDRSSITKDSIVKMLQQEQDRAVGGRALSRRRGKSTGQDVVGRSSDEDVVEAIMERAYSPQLRRRRVAAEPPEVEATRAMDERATPETIASAPAAEEPGAAERRHLNAWIEDAEPPLETMRAYQLAVNVGKPREPNLASRPMGEPDFKDEAFLELLVVVGGHGFSIGRRQHTLRLPRAGDSEVVHFSITPLVAAPLLRISLYLSSDFTLLEEFEIPVKAVAHSRAA